MTAQKSSNNFFVNFMARIKSQNKTSVLVFILHMLSAPLFIVMALIYFSKFQSAYNQYGPDKLYSYVPDSHLEMYAVIAIIATIIAVLCGIFISLGNFNYLFRKSNVDMVYSLPMSNRFRFLSDFFAGLASYIVPFLVSSVFTVILGAVLNNFLKTSTAFQNNYDKINLMPILWKLILFGTIIMILLYTICIFAIQFSGTMLVAVANCIGINIMLPATIGIIQLGFIANLFGLADNTALMPLFSVSSPFGAGYYCLNNIVSGYGDGFIDNNYASNWFSGWLLPVIAVCLLFGIGAYFIYRKRKAEDVSKPYVYRSAYYVLMVMVTFAIMAIFEFADSITGNIIPMIIIIGLFWFIVSLIINKGFKKMWRTGIEFALSFVIIFSLIYINDVTGGFGTVKRIPDIKDIESVTTNYMGIYDEYYYNKDNTVTLTDRSNIAKIYDAHHATVDNYKKDEYRYYRDKNSYNFTIRYNLKDGTTLTRQYYSYKFDFSKMCPIEKSDEFIDKHYDLIYNNLIDSCKGGKNSIYVGFSPMYQDMSDGQSYSQAETIKPLMEAVKEDIKAMSYAEYINSSEKIMGILKIDDYMSISLNSNYKNTIRWLELNGFNLNSYDINENDLIDIFGSSGFEKFSHNQIGEEVNFWFDLRYLNINKLSESDQNELKEIFSNARTFCVSSDYISFWYNGNNYYITGEDMDRLISYSDDKSEEEYYNDYAGEDIPLN